MRWVGKVADIDDPDKDTNNADHFREHVTKVVQLALERRLFGDLGRNGFVNVADGCLLSGIDDDGPSITIDDGGSLQPQIRFLVEV